MANYLNSIKPFSLFKSERSKPYFVDKSLMIEELLPLIQENGSYVCITRPRRFGKTFMASMLAAYLEKGRQGEPTFKDLEIAKAKAYAKHLNAHDVIYIALNETPRECKTYEQYIHRIEHRLMEDLKTAYPNCAIHEEEALWDALNRVYETMETGFVFVLDEWDYIFHRNFVAEKDKMAYVDFLSNLLKNQPYVELAYMTGILPIAKYSSGSELNMFCEYTMAMKERYSEYFGFSDREVDELYQRYQKATKTPQVTRDGLRLWYDGYHTLSGSRIYNPRSVVCALSDNQLDSYWTSTGPYDEIFYYIEHNTAAVREDLALMVSGIPVVSQAREYAATSMNLTTKDEIFSAMLVYGFLSYEKGKVSIPNKELMDKFDDMLKKEPSLGYIYQLAKESERLLQATLAGDTDTVCKILEYTHNTEIPLLKYNTEEDLTVVVTLAYLSARDKYQVERERKAGIGYADFIFTPNDDRADCLILELKVDDTPKAAIQQIKSHQYALKFMGMPSEKPKYTGRILAVGIAYDRQSKKHSCQIEVLRKAIQ